MGQALAASIVLAASSLLGVVAPATAAPRSVGAARHASASAVLRRTLAAVRAAHSVHVVLHLRHGNQRAEYVDDSGTGLGRQVIRLKGGASATVLVVGGNAYMQGDATALRTFFGFPASVASGLAGNWISIAPGQPGYSQVSAGITLQGVVAQLRLRPPLHLIGRKTVHGVHALVLRGRPPKTSGAPRGAVVTIDVSARGRPLPLSFADGTGSERVSGRFSHWGEQLQLTAPNTTQPITSTGG